MTARLDPLCHIARLCLGLSAVLTVGPVLGWLPAFLLTGLVMAVGDAESRPPRPEGT